MRKDVTFSNGKLNTEEFSRKYWLNGEAPYQYHTANIEDGRDEREQFLINNIRALWERDKFHDKYNQQAHCGFGKRIKRITALAVTSAVIGVTCLILALLTYLK